MSEIKPIVLHIVGKLSATEFYFQPEICIFFLNELLTNAGTAGFEYNTELLQDHLVFPGSRGFYPTSNFVLFISVYLEVLFFSWRNDMKKAEIHTKEFFNLGGYKNHLRNPEAKALFQRVWILSPPL